VLPDPDRPAPAGAVGHRQRRKNQTRVALASAAVRLVAEHGLDRVTVEEISSAANVSPRTFFNYFSSKEDAVTRLGVDATERICEGVRTAPAELGALAAIHRAMHAEAVTLDADPTDLTRQLAIIERHPELWPRLVASGEVLAQELTGVISERVGLDPVEHSFPGLVTSVALATSRSAMVRWCRVNHSRPLADLMDEAFHLLGTGLPDPL
jgi:AcrR family transcriptional regulator